MSKAIKSRRITPFRAKIDDERDDRRDDRVPERLRDLPRRVEQANERHGYNQTVLAHKMGVTQSVLSNLSRGSNLYGLRLSTIYALAEVLEVSVAWLLGEGDSPEPPPRKRATARKKKSRRR